MIEIFQELPHLPRPKTRSEGAVALPHKHILDTFCLDLIYHAKAIIVLALVILFYKYISFQNLLGQTIYFPEIISVATLIGPYLLDLRK